MKEVEDVHVGCINMWESLLLLNSTRKSNPLERVFDQTQKILQAFLVWPSNRITIASGLVVCTSEEQKIEMRELKYCTKCYFFPTVIKVNFMLFRSELVLWFLAPNWTPMIHHLVCTCFTIKAERDLMCSTVMYSSSRTCHIVLVELHGDRRIAIVELGIQR